MMTLYLFVLTLLGFATSFQADPFTFPYDSGNTCASCLLGGNVFCVKKPDNYTVPKDQLDPDTKCCPYGSQACDGTYGVFNDPEWFCSKEYNSTSYALAGLCPKRPSVCGDKQVHQLGRMNDNFFFSVKNLIKGEHCTYRLEGLCGGPSFQVLKKTKTSYSKYGITYLEFNSQMYNFFKGVPKTLKKGDSGWNFSIIPNITRRYNETYMKGMPCRNQTVDAAGNQGLYSKQLLPRRKFSNGLYTYPEYLGQKKDDDKPVIDNGYAYVGYGLVTSGEYSTSKKYWKTFGSVGQGKYMQAVKGDSQPDCAVRSVFLTIYAKEDFSSEDEVFMEFATWPFDEPSTGASIQVTGANGGKQNTIDWSKFPSGASIMQVSASVLSTAVLSILSDISNLV